MDTLHSLSRSPPDDTGDDALVSIERRSLLWLPMALVGGVLVAAAPRCAATEMRAVGTEDEAFTPLTRKELGDRWVKLASALRLLPDEADETYAAQLTGIVSRVPLSALPQLAAAPEAKGISGGPAWFLTPCLAIEFKMRPGAVLKHHNHPPQVVVTLGIEGEARYEHFEIEGEAPPCTRIDGAEFRVRRTRTGLLTPHRSTSLTRVRDGIHGFAAGKEGARILDFTVLLTEDSSTFSYVDIEDDPVDAERGVFKAVWTGKDR